MTENEPEIIEAEIVEEPATHSAKRAILGKPVLRANEPPPWHTPGDHARPYGDRGGLLGGFLVLAVGFVVTVAVLLFSVCVVIPLSLLARLLRAHQNH